MLFMHLAISAAHEQDAGVREIESFSIQYQASSRSTLHIIVIRSEYVTALWYAVKYALLVRIFGAGAGSFEPEVCNPMART